MSDQLIQAQKCLRVVPQEHAFYCCDGQVFYSLEELYRGFQQMDEQTFLYHSQRQRNDFAAWVEDIIGDGELAQRLEKASQDLKRACHELKKGIERWDRIIEEVADKIAFEDKFFFFEF